MERQEERDRRIRSIRDFFFQFADFFTGEIRYNNFGPGGDDFIIQNVQMDNLGFPLLQRLHERKVPINQVAVLEIYWAEFEQINMAVKVIFKKT